MKDATKRFLKYRPNAQYIEKVEHRPNTDYKQRECISMTIMEAKNFGSEFISGWLIDEYRADINATPIIHHCWNIEKNGTHYDTIPVREKKYDYVSDPDVNKPYKYKTRFYWSPVIYLNDELKIIIPNGKQATITEEEHKRFINEHQ